MRRIVRSVAFLFLVLATSSAAFGQRDKEGSKDYPGMTRMPGYYIYEHGESQFDSATFTITKNGQDTQQQVEGHLITFHYCIKDGAAATSTLQVIRNYENAARAAGGQVLRDAETNSGMRREATIRLTRGTTEVWLAIEARSDAHWITVIEKQTMRQDVAIDAAALKGGLSANGKVDVYGIYFDTGKSELKPESDAALAEIAKMLKQSPALKVFVVGHTDMVGDPAMNVRLSLSRAQSAVNALVTKYGIASSRLTPFGNGPYAPVGSNKSEEGRAKNRSVELVEVATS
jgi:OmpA-OmpF porin, OOP family